MVDVVRRARRRRTPRTAAISPAPRSSAVDGSGTRTVPTSLPPLPPASGTFWNLTYRAFAIWVSVNPENAAPVTVNDALSPGNNPSFTLPPEKFPLAPVRKPKSRTTVLKPCGTLPRSASEKVKLLDRLGACMPVNPLRPEALALPVGGKSNPNAVIVDVDPGWVMADVFVAVKVRVFV